MKLNKIIWSESLLALEDMPDNYFDSMVTDPPAGIGFMNKEFDENKGGRDIWIKWLSDIMGEALRVMKPGAHAFVWSLPRTSHWTGMALENAGFEVRDIVHHIFGQGFPKSLDVSKAIDKLAGVERTIIGKRKGQGSNSNSQNEWGLKPNTLVNITEPMTEPAKQYNGWGTALKPATECWWLVRKPLSESTVAQNVMLWGTGALNLDACRIGSNGGTKTNPDGDKQDKNNILGKGYAKNRGERVKGLGRFPTNLIHDGSDPIMKEFEKYGNHTSGEIKPHKTNMKYGFLKDLKYITGSNTQSSGLVSRFFYCAKPSKAERDMGLDSLSKSRADNRIDDNKFDLAEGHNIHPTVKSQKLMRYLITMITPIHGKVIDPFCGSGSTCMAAKSLNRKYIGIDISSKYCEIARLRIKAVTRGWYPGITKREYRRINGLNNENK